MRIKYEIGICNGCGEDKLITHKSLHLCTSCNEKRKKARYVKNTNKRRRSRGISRDKDRDFYKRIWRERPHVCYETGTRLAEVSSTLFFHHVLPKRLYPQYRYCDWNIVLLRPDIHALVESSLDKAPKVKQYTEELKQKYLNKLR
jgi:hypothetical protein